MTSDIRRIPPCRRKSLAARSGALMELEWLMVQNTSTTEYMEVSCTMLLVKVKFGQRLTRQNWPQNEKFKGMELSQ
jgi:hypothetical protein